MDRRQNKPLLKTFLTTLMLPSAASAVSGFLLSLAFPEYDMGWLAWVALVPLMAALTGRKPLAGFFVAYLGGMAFFFSVFSWILKIDGYRLIHHLVLDLYLSLYFGIFGGLFAFVSNRRGPATALLSAPFLWCLLEYVRCNFTFLALPMSIVGHSQYRFATVLQMASLAGAYGVSFLVMAVNAGLTACLLAWATCGKTSANTVPTRISRRGAAAVAGWAAVLFVTTVFYGQGVLSTPFEGKHIKVSIVQGNIDQNQKWNPRFSKTILQTYTDLTLAAAAQSPDLIVWPEAATPGSILDNRRLHTAVKQTAATAGTYLLLGSAQQRKLRPPRKGTWRSHNSAFLLPPDGQDAEQRYDKIRLMPFGEYLPWSHILPWSLLNIKERGAFYPGDVFTVFKTPEFQFGTTICWENLFPDLTRRFVREGAQFIVNITNIAHFGKSAVPYQVASMNVFRAVENRVYVVRCTNTGVSCFINPYGRIVGRVVDGSGRDIFVRGILTEPVSIAGKQTVYTRYGDWFIGLCGMASLGVLAASAARRRHPLGR